MKKHAKKIVVLLLAVAMLVPTIAMIMTSAATQVPVELAFNNLFVFENWATNTLSTTLIKEGTPISGNNPSEGGTLAIDIANGKITMTKDDLSIANLYTACSMSKNPTENIGYYNANLKANTEYEFSYNLSGTTTAFVPYIFFFDSSNSFIDYVYFSDTEAGTKRYKFTTPANTSHIQIRFGINDTTTSHPGVSSVNAVIDTIKISEVVPSPQTGNLFRFDDWADTPSSKIATGNATLTTDKVNNTFTITRTSGTGEIYNTFSMSATDPAANTGLYSIEVQPNTEYSLVYTTYNTTEAALDTFFPLFFVFDKDNKYIDGQMIQGTSNGNIDKSEGSVDRAYTFRYDFTTPANAGNVQIRFTFQDTTASTTVSVKNIVFCESEIISQNNLFDYDEWASTAGTYNGGISALHPNGSLTKNATDKSIAITTNSNPSSVTLTYVDFGLIEQGYAIPVEPGKTYTITYNLDFGSCVGIAAFTEVRIFTAWYNSAKTFTGYANHFPSNIANNGENTISFTVPAGTYYIQFAFANYKPVAGSKVVFNNVEFYETDISSYGLFEETGEKPVDPHRQAYTYEGNGETYGTLPVPSEIPDGYVFAGWYTGENGTGNLITKDTPIHYDSLTVYSKFEPAVDSLSVATMPTRVTYTVGEKFNPAGLVLNATTDGNSVSIASGYRCSPEYLTTAGEQTITAEYGGKSITFKVTVNSHDESSITVNGVAHSVQVANNKYTLDYTASSAFNRYEITYYSDSYVRAIITFDGPDGDIEEFFLEPSDNGSFASYIDNFLKGQNHYGVMTIEFTCLDKEYGKFELYTLSTISAPVPANTVQYYENEKYKVGIDLAFGGVISYIECLEGSTATGNNVVAAQYTDSNGKVYTKVDYEDKLPAGAIATVESVNLINTQDKGRYLQQSYYGTDQPPFIKGDYNGTPWKYNPVQGGNLDSLITDNGGESSKVIDYRITQNQIYVKTRPLDWAKNSIDYGQNKNDPAWNTPSYMEAWYTFTTDGKGLIQGTCRFVDYSGYPANTTDQEFPAFYTIEPLNHYVFNNVTKDQAWAATQEQFKNDSYLTTVEEANASGTGAINIEEPEFWGPNPNYIAYAPNGSEIDNDVNCYENWAAFTASEDKESFGIGVYSPGVTDFTYGCFLPKYVESQYNANGEYGNKEDGEYIKAQKANTLGSYTHITNYRHASTLNPSEEQNTSYIAPVEKLTFESYTPITYTYYVSTGTADEIREDFRRAKEAEENADKEVTKLAVPETVYMTPVADGATHTKVGQFYVNNILTDLNVIETVAESTDNMYFGLYALDAKQFSVKVTNATNPSDDIELYNLISGSTVEGQVFSYPADGTFRADNTYGLRFKNTGLKHNEMATAKWEITVTLNDNTTQTYTAYTVLYAPGYTVGAVAESRRRSVDNNETGTWISGATSMVTDSNGAHQLTPIGGWEKGDPVKSGYFIQDPLVYPENMTTESTDQTADDHINVASNSSEYYVMQTAVQSNDHSRAKSYLGLLTIDQSRYSNTNQIPNLKIGYDVLHVHDGRNDALKDYKTSYTLGTAESFNPSGSGDANIQAYPSGWSTEGLVGNGRIQNWKDSPYATPFRQSVIPNYAVSSDMDGKYIHSVSQALSNYLGDRTYGTSVASVMIKITDKSALRDAVLEGYGKTDGTPLFNEKLENAATVLGDPTSTQEEIDTARKELNDSQMYALKYDNLFSALEFSQHSANMTVSGGGTAAYENSTIVIKNDTITAGETYTEYSSASNYYKIGLKPNTEYVFEYDVTTTSESQAFLFFYDTNGNATKVTGRSVQTDNGAIVPNTEDVPHFGNYQHGAGTKHYTIRFTTGSDIGSVGFRFGNTTNNPCTSTFSNIKLIDSVHYYEGASYEKTEAAYAKDVSYASLITPTRPGYTFVKWVDAANETVSGSTVATDHLTVYSVWTANSYKVTYNPNGGSVSPISYEYTTGEKFTIPIPSRSGYLFQGWKVTASDGSWKVGDIYQPGTAPSGMYGNATLTAQWGANNLTVYFDTILDFDKWNKSSSNGTVSGITDNGFTLTSNEGVGEATCESPEFPITAGKTYYVDVDIEGNNWDIYFFSRNESGTWTDIDANSKSTSDGINPSRTFTAPSGSVKAAIRLDANGSSNTVTFSDIRVYEAGTRAANVNVPDANMTVTYGESFGTLPVPTREGYTFLGWYDENDTQVVDNQTVNYTSAVYLKSKWAISNDALVKDDVVIDFGAPVVIEPLKNDKLKDVTFLGISADGENHSKAELTGTYGTFTVTGETVTYKPTKAVDGVDTIYYHASVTDTDGTTTKLQNEITVVPASNVLYEETFFTDKDSTGLQWNAPSDAKALDTVQTAYPEKEVYGYDKNYDKYNNYSDGTALQVNVTATNKRSMIKMFDFAGSGFDLNGVCGKDTGVLIVSLMDTAANDGKGKMVKSYVIDTYYNDVDANSNPLYANNLYQVPVLHEDDIDYGNYKIQIVASWLPTMSGAINAAEKAETQAVEGFDGMTVSSATVEDDAYLREALEEIGMEDILNAEEVEVIWFDDNSVLNGGTGASDVDEGMMETASLENFALVNIIDSVRVYNPLDGDDQYYIDTEKGAQYFNVMDNLVNGDSSSTITGSGNYFAYVSGKELGNIDIAHYKEFGPKDELYLAKAADENAIAFTIKNFKDSGAKVAISLRAASLDDTVTVKIGGTDFDVKSNTEMYYDITDCVEPATGTVTIQNITEESLLSIGSVKITGVIMGTSSLSSDIDLATVRTMMMAPSVTIDPNMPDAEPEIPEEPAEPEVPADPEDPAEPEDPTDPEDPSDDPADDPTEDPADDNDEEGCWLVRLFKWLVEKFTMIFNAVKSILGF